MHRLPLGMVVIVSMWMLWTARTPWQARADKAVAVLSIRGPGAKRMRSWLESEIQDRFSLVAREVVKDAASELGIHRHLTRRSNLKRIARKARVDALVTAYVYRARRRWWLAVRVHDGATGRVVKAGVVRYRYFALTRWVKAAIWKTVRRGVAAAEGVPHPRPRLAPPPEETRRPPPPKKKKKKAIGPRPAWLYGLRGELGFGIMGRRLTIADLNGDPGTQVIYQTTAPTWPLFFSVEVFPGAFVSRHRVLSNIGIGFRYQEAFGVVSQRETDRVRTTIRRVEGYLLVRWNIFATETSPELTFTFGVDALNFGFDEDLKEAASVMYIAVRPEVQARFPLRTERVALDVRLAGMGVLSMGQMADAYHYGASQAGGVHAEMAVDVRLGWRIHLLVGAWLDWFFITFPQVGDIHLDYELVADSARDGYYGGYARLAMCY